MDTFGEQLVKKATTGADWAKRIGIAVLGLALATVLMWLSFFTGFMILTMLSVGALFGLVWLLTGMSYEYEYILTNDDLDIDKITGKRKRKRLITLKMNTVEEFGIYDGTNGANADATVIASDGTNINAYYLIAKHKTHGRTMLIFSPDARMVEMILTTLPYKVKQEATQRINAIKRTLPRWQTCALLANFELCQSQGTLPSWQSLILNVSMLLYWNFAT